MQGHTVLLALLAGLSFRAFLYTAVLSVPRTSELSLETASKYWFSIAVLQLSATNSSSES
jgi:hypothetical protein